MGDWVKDLQSKLMTPCDDDVTVWPGLSNVFQARGLQPGIIVLQFKNGIETEALTMGYAWTALLVLSIYAPPLNGKE